MKRVLNEHELHLAALYSHQHLWTQFYLLQRTSTRPFSKAIQLASLQPPASATRVIHAGLNLVALQPLALAAHEAHAAFTPATMHPCP